MTLPLTLSRLPSGGRYRVPDGYFSRADLAKCGWLRSAADARQDDIPARRRLDTAFAA